MHIPYVYICGVGWLLRSQIQFSAWKNQSPRACRYRERTRSAMANLSISLSNSNISGVMCAHCERVESRRTFQHARLLLHSFILAGSYMTRPLSSRTRTYTFLRRSLYISIRTNNIPFLSISLLISPFGRSVAKTHQRTHTHTRPSAGWTSPCALMCRLGLVARTHE